MAESSPSRIPTPVSSLRRSASVRVRGERPIILYSTSPTPFPSIAEKEEACHLTRNYSTPTRYNLGHRSQSQASGLNKRDDDLDSVDSFSSNVSQASTRSNCEHSLFAKNGTTFSSRTHKFIVHCSGHGNHSEEYLTPTQRANRNVRRLKTLLELAKEKLVEKEKEIFKLTKEVVELKVFKASVKNGFSEASTPSDEKDTSEAVAAATFAAIREFPCDTPDKESCCGFDDKIEEEPDKEKLSPVSPFHAYHREKFTATPDYLLSSLADSGHFDDLISIQSKDSLNIPGVSDDHPDGAPNQNTAQLVNMYETLLRESKETHENELRSVQLAQEENNMKMIDAFEKRLKDEESVFEMKFEDLLKTTENDKIKIVERFEKRLEEERLMYVVRDKRDTDAQTEIYNSDCYIRKIDEEKQNYETSLAAIKKNFELEREKIEKSFDETMFAEREKFELAVQKIQKDYDERVAAITEKSTGNDKMYTELLEKYQSLVAKFTELEKENEKLKYSLSDQESRQKELYLKMFLKGQEAVKFQRDENQAPSVEQSSSLPVPELLVQLKVTEVELENLKDKEYRAQHSDARGISLISAKEALSLWMLAARKVRQAMYSRLTEAQSRSVPEQPRVQSTHAEDPEATLQFLKSAVYYFLTDRDNHVEHLRAIESILGFSQNERRDIETHYVH